jgi:hypothetical protein
MRRLLACRFCFHRNNITRLPAYETTLQRRADVLVIVLMVSLIRESHYYRALSGYLSLSVAQGFKESPVSKPTRFFEA